VDNATDAEVLRTLPFVSEMQSSRQAGVYSQVEKGRVYNIPGIQFNAKGWS
jgi:hypothetical protein